MRDKFPELKAMAWFNKGDACELAGCWKSRFGRKGDDLNQEFRDAIGQVLYNWSHELKEPILEQVGKQYRVIRKEFKTVKPGKGSANRFDLKWPRGVDDNSSFSFAETIVITKGDVIGLGGEGNKGKSCFGLNLAIENMDTHDVTLVLSENVHRLDERLSHFDWVDIFKPNGDWRFEVIEEKGAASFLDVVRERPNNLVILDWLNVTKDAYRVSDFYESLTERTDGGAVFVIQQKRSYKDYVVGGEAALDYSSVFLLLEAGKIRVVKAKVYDYFDPNDKMYCFNIVKGGSRFSGIAEIYNCPTCKGSKNVKGETCGRCYGKGYLFATED